MSKKYLQFLSLHSWNIYVDGSKRWAGIERETRHIVRHTVLCVVYTDRVVTLVKHELLYCNICFRRVSGARTTAGVYVSALLATFLPPHHPVYKAPRRPACRFVPRLIEFMCLCDECIVVAKALIKAKLLLFLWSTEYSIFVCCFHFRYFINHK